MTHAARASGVAARALCCSDGSGVWGLMRVIGGKVSDAIYVVALYEGITWARG